MEEFKGRPMIDVDKLLQVATGTMKTNTVVGREVINGRWFSLFVATRKDGTIKRDDKGQVLLNRK